MTIKGKKITEFQRWKENGNLRLGDHECECCGGIIVQGKPTGECEECYDDCKDGVSCFDGRAI